MQGRFGAAAQIFDLSHDGQEWTLYLPQARQVVRGDASTPAIELINPTDYIDALMPGLIPLGDGNPETVVEEYRGGVRISVPPGSGTFHRVLELDSRTGVLTRLEIRRESRLEEPLLTATYSQYEGGFPRRIRVERQGAWATMEVRSYKACEVLDPRRFRIRIPHGTEEIPVEYLGYEFLPQVEASP